MRPSRKWPGRAVRTAVAIAIIGGVIALYHVVTVNATTVGFSLLLAILGISAVWGLLEATVASIVAVLGFNFFFLPPVGTFTIADPQNWVALFAFLVTAVVASQLSTAAKRRATEAIQRREEVEKLHALGQSLLLRGSPHTVFHDTVHRMVEIFGLRSAGFYDRLGDEVIWAGDRGHIQDTELRSAAEEQSPRMDALGGVALVPVRLGGHVLGGLCLMGEIPSEGILNSLAYQLAIGIERARALEEAARAEAERRSETLKSAMLDALAHDLKTPLTAVKAAVTALLPMANSDGARELLTIIHEEASRLNQIVAEVLQLAQIESGKLRLDRRDAPLRDLILQAAQALPGVSDRVRIQLPDQPLDACVDGDLIVQVLKHLLDNACKYSSPGSPVAVRADACDGEVRVSVQDVGPGIDEPDQPHIFEKFFRGHESRYEVAGTGMGLAIARAIVEAHGGRIWAESKPGQGSVFTFTLPSSGVRSTT